MKNYKFLVYFLNGKEQYFRSTAIYGAAIKAAAWAMDNGYDHRIKYAVNIDTNDTYTGIEVNVTATSQGVVNNK